MIKITKYYYLTITFLLAGLGPAHAQDILRKSFSGIDKLEIKAGAIEVQYEGHENLGQLDMEAFLGSSENAEEGLIMVTIGNTLKIAYNAPRGNWRSKRYLKIKGPVNMQLNIRSGSGSLFVSGINAPFHVIEASSGQIKVRDIRGDLDLRASSGNIQLANLTGNLDCQLSSGNATIEAIEGNMNFKATSGQLKANSVSGILHAKLTSGNMKLSRIGELGNLEITSGNIKAEQAGLGAMTSMRGSSGNIQITTYSSIEDYNYDLNAGSGNIRVGNQSGKKSLQIQNGKETTINGRIGSGNISIQPR
jgi:DUF4097 and DUF4098 domain-containing protein YvlB